MIKNGLVKVNNQNVLDPFYQVDPENDHVTIDNISLSKGPDTKVYIALNKPVGYISDLADPKGRPIARDLIRMGTRLYPVGRLDFASEGLLFFTNDGGFADKVLHPRNQIEREYQVKVQKRLSPAEMQQLITGRRIDGLLYRLRSVKLLSLTSKNAWYTVTATEGRNRMIRKLVDSLGHRVLRLRRARIGSVRLGKLRPGEYRHLTTTEIRKLLNKESLE